jgi:N-acyl homoserine lactone hydrolase
MTIDAAASAASIDMIWGLWRRRPGTILVPGHDVPLVQENGECRYIGERQAAITAWFGDDLKTTTSFQLTTG